MLPNPMNFVCRSRWFYMAMAALAVLAALVGVVNQVQADPITPYVVWIHGKGSTNPYLQSLAGRYQTMCVSAGTDTSPVLYASRFGFLVCYDELGITFIGATPGYGLPPEWEYFAYRADTIGTLCGTCPSNSVRLTGIASLAEGSPQGLPLYGCLVELTYYVGTDQNYTESCERIEFCALECGDNVVTSGDGDSLYLPLSGILAGPDYDAPTCLTPDGGAVPAACIEYAYGAICNNDWGEYGDLNLNGIGFEVGDAVWYISYFTYGPVVLDPTWGEVQRFSSDINQDGRVLTIADLVYLIWITTRQANAYPPDYPPKVAATGAEVTLQTSCVNGEVRVQTTAPVGIGGIHFLYHYSDCRPDEPVASLPPGMVMGSSARDGELRITIYPDLENPGTGYPPGDNELLSIPLVGSGTIELVDAQISAPDGQVLDAKIAGATVPDLFTLSQNFPNPFNAGTMIPYSLRDDAWVRLEIVDILGRTVARPVDQFQSAGSYKYEWRGTDASGRSVASGMYFYRLAVGDRVLTKKMVLLK